MGIEQFITSIAVQTITYWGNPQPDGYGGTTFNAPVVLKCRWDNVTKLIRTGQGKEIACRAEVLVTQDMDVGGYLYLGSSVVANPMLVEGAYEILRFDKIPMIKSTSEFVRKAYL